MLKNVAQRFAAVRGARVRGDAVILMYHRIDVVERDPWRLAVTPARFAEQLAQRMTERLPGLIIVGTDTPPFRPLTAEENDAAIERINAADPDCLWLGVSTPKQDIWLYENRERINAPVVLAVGAAFDFLSGARARAPEWMQRSGLEWSFRLIAEPRRLWRRYTVVNLQFIGLVLREALRPRSRAG